jgi:hypothetical protein
VPSYDDPHIIAGQGTIGLEILEQAAEVVTPLSHRRLTVASALADDETAYLHDGRRS